MRNRLSLYFSPRRLVASCLLLTFSAACTHTPTGEKAFNSFEQCVATNLTMAGAGGIGVGVLTAGLAAKLTGDRAFANRLGTAAGIGSAIAIGITAWRKCAAVYSTSVVETPAPTAPALPPTAAAREARLSLDRLEVKVGGSENDPPEPQFNFTYLAANNADKDIKARLRHKVELVRFKAGEGDQFFLVDSADQFLLDASNKPIPLDRANSLPRERLSWLAIALEGQEDYVEDVVIQQGASARFRHLLQMPNRQQLPVPLPLPMRYSLTVEAAGLSANRTVDFALLKTAERPKLYAAAAVRGNPAVVRATPAVAPVAAPVVASPVTAAEPSSTATSHKLKRSNNLFSDTTPKRKVVGRLLLNAVVNIDESSEVVTAGKPVTWVKVSATNGLSGWLPKSELMETK